MSDYRRWISYIYAYENGVKKKSAGYAKLELKDGKLTMTLHVTPDNREGNYRVCLYKSQSGHREGVLLGNMEKRQGGEGGQFQENASDLKGSGLLFQEMNGLLLYDERGKYLISSWEDEPVEIPVLQEIVAMLERGRANEEGAKEERGGQEERAVKKEENKAQEKRTEKEGNAGGVAAGSTKIENAEKTERRMEAGIAQDEGIREMEALQDEGTRKGKATKDRNGQAETGITAQEKRKTETGTRSAAQTENAAQSESMIQTKSTVQTENVVQKEREMLLAEVENKKSGMAKPQDMNIGMQLSTAEVRSEETPLKAEMPVTVKEEKSAQDSPKPNTTPVPGKLETRIFSCLPAMYPFEHQEFERSVRMDPQDIGLLPRDMWKYAGNSFLLHSYYAYHHILFTRKVRKEGRNCYLMLPGTYNSKEQHMAQLFGFSRFCPVHKKALQQGDFGYWYMEVEFPDSVS